MLQMVCAFFVAFKEEETSHCYLEQFEAVIFSALKQVLVDSADAAAVDLALQIAYLLLSQSVFTNPATVKKILGLLQKEPSEGGISTSAEKHIQQSRMLTVSRWARVRGVTTRLYGLSIMPVANCLSREVKTLIQSMIEQRAVFWRMHWFATIESILEDPLSDYTPFGLYLLNASAMLEEEAKEAVKKEAGASEEVEKTRFLLQHTLFLFSCDFYYLEKLRNQSAPSLEDTLFCIISLQRTMPQIRLIYNHDAICEILLAVFQVISHVQNQFVNNPSPEKSLLDSVMRLFEVVLDVVTDLSFSERLPLDPDFFAGMHRNYDGSCRSILEDTVGEKNFVSEFLKTFDYEERNALRMYQSVVVGRQGAAARSDVNVMCLSFLKKFFRPSQASTPRYGHSTSFFSTDDVLSIDSLFYSTPPVFRRGSCSPSCFLENSVHNPSELSVVKESDVGSTPHNDILSDSHPESRLESRLESHLNSRLESHFDSHPDSHLNSHFDSHPDSLPHCRHDSIANLQDDWYRPSPPTHWRKQDYVTLIPPSQNSCSSPYSDVSVTCSEGASEDYFLPSSTTVDTDTFSETDTASASLHLSRLSTAISVSPPPHRYDKGQAPWSRNPLLEVIRTNYSPPGSEEESVETPQVVYSDPVSQYPQTPDLLRNAGFHLFAKPILSDVETDSHSPVLRRIRSSLGTSGGATPSNWYHRSLFAESDHSGDVTQWKDQFCRPVNYCVFSFLNSVVRHYPLSYQIRCFLSVLKVYSNSSDTLSVILTTYFYSWMVPEILEGNRAKKRMLQFILQLVKDYPDWGHGVPADLASSVVCLFHQLHAKNRSDVLQQITTLWSLLLLLLPSDPEVVLTHITSLLHYFAAVSPSLEDACYYPLVPLGASLFSLLEEQKVERLFALLARRILSNQRPRIAKAPMATVLVEQQYLLCLVNSSEFDDFNAAQIMLNEVGYAKRVMVLMRGRSEAVVLHNGNTALLLIGRVLLTLAQNGMGLFKRNFGNCNAFDKRVIHYCCRLYANKKKRDRYKERRGAEKAPMVLNSALFV